MVLYAWPSVFEMSLGKTRRHGARLKLVPYYPKRTGLEYSLD